MNLNTEHKVTVSYLSNNGFGNLSYNGSYRQPSQIRPQIQFTRKQEVPQPIKQDPEADFFDGWEELDEND